MHSLIINFNKYATVMAVCFIS